MSDSDSDTAIFTARPRANIGSSSSDDDDDDDASEKSNSDSEEETPEKNKGNRRDRRKDKDTRADKKDTDKKTQPEDTPDALKLEDEQVTTREFSWQHKVFSKQEVTYYKSLENPTTMLENKYQREIEEHGIEGSILFTYVHADEFNLKNESSRTVTTSITERLNHLTWNIFGGGASKATHKLAQPVHFQSMCIIAELESDEREEKVLVTIKDFLNGSFDLQPGFTAEGASYRFELQDGAVYEYSIQSTDKATKKSDFLRQGDKKAGVREDPVSDRTYQLRKNLVGSKFEALPGPSPNALRVILNMELMSARGFNYDNLYIEYFVKLGPGWWTSNKKALRGVTQISKTTTYPVDPLSKEDPMGAFTKVAHFCFPIELELVAQEEPKPSEWPTIYFQVASYDQWDRFRTVAYCYLPVFQCCPGSQVHRLATWKPAGNINERMHTFFVGGAPELDDITYLATPAGFNGKALNKYGFAADASGEVKVRTSMMYHGRTVVAAYKKVHVSAMGEGRANKLVNKAVEELKAPSSGPRSMAQIVERARLRLAEARRDPPKKNQQDKQQEKGEKEGRKDVPIEARTAEGEGEGALLRDLSGGVVTTTLQGTIPYVQTVG
mmetsp:Transcript_7138/g.12372  ORF Transcript_7138/g.12372 Transcript_7138/m.12372 type:complete len:611 (+) Transcript_7138:335-2167(+)